MQPDAQSSRSQCVVRIRSQIDQIRIRLSRINRFRIDPPKKGSDGQMCKKQVIDNFLKSDSDTLSRKTASVPTKNLHQSLQKNRICSYRKPYLSLQKTASVPQEKPHLSLQKNRISCYRKTASVPPETRICPSRKTGYATLLRLIDDGVQEVLAYFI